MPHLKISRPLACSSLEGGVSSGQVQANQGRGYCDPPSVSTWLIKALGTGCQALVCRGQWGQRYRGGGSCVHSPLFPFRDRDKLHTDDIRAGFFYQGWPWFRNEHTDRPTDRQTDTHTHTHTHHLGPSYPKRAEERNQGLAHLLFSPSLPPSLHLLFFITRCLFKQTARTDMANILKSFSKSSCKSQANLYRETEAFWFWVEIIKFFLCYFQQTQMSLRDLCCGGYCPSILC